MSTLLRITPTSYDGRLRKVTMRYVPNLSIATRTRADRLGTSFNAVNTLNAITDEIKTAVYRAARRAGFPQGRRELRGTLSIFTPKYNSSRAITDFNIADLTFGRLTEKISEMVQSNYELEYTDLEFTFYYNRYQMMLGAGLVTRPKWWRTPNKFTWITYQDDQGPINCAAISLAYGMDPSVNRTVLATKGRELQTRLGWTDLVSVAQIKDFVDVNPEYRVTVLLLQSYADSSATTFTGNEYNTDIEDGTILPPNTLYLYYHVNGNIGHYVWIKSVQTIIRNYKNSNTLNFCHKCVQVHGRVNHACLLREPVKYKAKCPLGCGIYHGNEKCPRIKCKSCENQYKRVNPNESYQVHTCLIKSDMKDPLEFQKDGCEDGKRQSLIVWDIESAFKKVTFETVLYTNR